MTEGDGGRFESLTIGRGIAALLIVLYHLDSHLGDPLRAVLPAIGYAPLGVDFFFCLSGFVLAHVHRASLEAGTYDHAGFVVKRLARVYPLHLATLLGALALAAVGHLLGQDPATHDSVGNFLANLFMVHAWGTTGGLSWNQPSWSISAEWGAYLVFPFAAIIVLRLRSDLVRIAVALAFYLAAEAVALRFIGHDLAGLTYDFGILRIAPGFFAGIVIHGLVRSVARDGRVHPDLALPLAAAAVVAMVAAAMLDVPGFAILLAMPVVIGLVALADTGRRPGTRFGRAMVYLGEISYAIYLVHGLVLSAVFSALARIGLGGGVRAIAAIVLSVGGTLGAAAIAHVAIELPARRAIMAWWTKRRSGRALA